MPLFCLFWPGREKAEVCNSIRGKVAKEVRRGGIIPTERVWRASQVGHLYEVPSKTLPLIWWSSKGLGCNLPLSVDSLDMDPHRSFLVLFRSGKKRLWGGYRSSSSLFLSFSSSTFSYMQVKWQSALNGRSRLWPRLKFRAWCIHLQK